MPGISLVRAYQELAREELNGGIVDLLPKIDPLYATLTNSWERVVENTIGRDAITADGTVNATNWVYRWLWSATGGGFFKMTNPNPALFDSINNSNDRNVNTLAKTSGWGNVSDYVTPRYVNPFIGLAEGRGFLALPFQLLRWRRARALVTDLLADHIRVCADLLAFSLAVNYFSRQPNLAEVVRTPALRGTFPHPAVSRTDLAGNTDVTRLTFRASGSTRAIDKNDPIQRLRPGMSVSIFQCHYTHGASGTLTITDMAPAGDTRGFIVDTVDFIGEAVSFVAKSGGTVQAPVASGNANDAVVYVVLLHESGALAPLGGTISFAVDPIATTIGSDTDALQDALTNAMNDPDNSALVKYGADGLESFIKSGYNETLYGVRIQRLPALKSMKFNLNTPDFLTERALNSWLGWVQSQLGVSNLPDVLVAQWGVWNAAVANILRLPYDSGNPAGTNSPVRQIYDRTGGRRQSISFGWDEVTVRIRNRAYRVMDSTMVARRTLYGRPIGENANLRLVAPPIQGATSKAGFVGAEFVGDLGGGRDGFVWSYEGGSPSDQLMAPFVITFQHFTKKPASLRVGNLAESIGQTDIPA